MEFFPIFKLIEQIRSINKWVTPSPTQWAPRNELQTERPSSKKAGSTLLSMAAWRERRYSLP